METTFSTAPVESETSTALNTKTKTLFTEQELDSLATTDLVRKSLIDLLVKDEKGNFKIPGASAEKILLAQLLDGRDKAAMSVAKVRVADKAAESAKDFNAMASAVLLNHRAPERRKATAQERKLPDDIKPENIVPGETAIGLRNFTFEEIMTPPEST